MAYVWDFAVLSRYWSLFLTGIGYTIAFAALTIVFGLAIGIVVGTLRLTRLRPLNAVLAGLIELFRCTPVLVQLVWAYYALPVVLRIQIPPEIAGVGVLSLYGGMFFAEIFRGGIISIEQGQWDAARALGLSWFRLMRLVILPQAIRRMIPPTMNQSILQLKDTALLSTITVPEILYQGTIITMETFRPLEVYTIVAIIYFLILFPTTLLVRRYEKAKGSTVSPGQKRLR